MNSILSEFGTLSLEFDQLSYETGNDIYSRKIQKILDVMEHRKPSNGLYPIYFNPHTSSWASSQVTLGALGDSFFEYLLKLYLLNGDARSKQMYDEASTAIVNQLVKKSRNGLTFIAEYTGRAHVDKMDHLACFAGAMFALGDAESRGNKFDIGARITNTCHEMYARTKTHLGAEVVYIDRGHDDISVGVPMYILRPEVVESYFVLYRLTGDQKYRDWAWEAFQAMEQHCRLSHGYSGISSVDSIPSSHDDLQQSFFMAETLKYIYLTFSTPDVVSLDEYVFNTEAHPLKRR